MKKLYVIYTQNAKTKKAVLDEQMLKKYKTNPEIKNIEEFENETLMEQTYASKINPQPSKKILND